MKRYRAKNRSLRSTSTDSKRATSVILENHVSAPIRRGSLSSTSKARREACGNKLVKKSGMTDKN